MKNAGNLAIGFVGEFGALGPRFCNPLFHPRDGLTNHLGQSVLPAFTEKVVIVRHRQHHGVEAAYWLILTLLRTSFL